ncbi:MAG: YkgJ family cysteine cluster protein [Proteobacteria bacterium]|nr:YkgJ family cysteine cluster protein [Pseudomonadota bacterium]MBU1717143.1 YkgJ family cysteine cluster protein [Pseudomonadota bacterium]
MYCKRCGTCCRKGGPGLHREDQNLLSEGHLSFDHLVTIRQGEIVLNPLTGMPEPAAQELVKINGRGGDWSCMFFGEGDSSCTIYRNRPLECRLLKCWDPADIEAVIGKDNLRRLDLLSPGDPARQMIESHEKLCPGHEITELCIQYQEEPGRHDLLNSLTSFVRHDLHFRMEVFDQLKLSSASELFFLGRPVFKVLAPFGLVLREDHRGISLSRI